MNFNPEDFDEAIWAVVARKLNKPAIIAQQHLASMFPQESIELAQAFIKVLQSGKPINDSVVFDMTCEKLCILVGYDRTSVSIDEAYAQLSRAILAKALGINLEYSRIIH